MPNTFGDPPPPKPLKDIPKQRHGGDLIPRLPLIKTPQKVLQAYESGKTCEEIATEYDVGDETIRRLLLRHKPEILRGRGPRKKDANACTTLLTLEEEMKVVDYYRAGKSLDEIEKLTSVSDSTVSKIIHRLAPYLIRPPILPPKPIKHQPSTLVPEKAFLIGHLIADGCVMKNHSIFYCNKNLGLVEKVAEVFEKVYGVPTRKIYKSKDGVFCVSWHRKKVWEDLVKYTKYNSQDWVVPVEIINDSTMLGPPFLRAVADDDGCVTLYPRMNGGWYRGVCLKTISSQGRLGLIRLLSLLNIKAYETTNTVVIGGRKNIESFKEIIGFTPGVKVLRGMWKWFDKAKVLELLLQSYRRVN